MIVALRGRWSGIEDDNLNLHILFLLTMSDASGNACEVIWRLPVHDLAVGSRMKRVACSQHRDRLQQIRLALGIVAGEEKKPWTQGEIKVCVVPKVV